MLSFVRKILGSNNFLSLANNGLVAIFGFLSFILLVRQLPQEVFGEWVLFITLSNFIDMLRFGITRTAIVRFLSGADQAETRRLMGSNNTINLFSTVVIVILIIILYKLFPETISNSGFELFFIWYPLLAFLNLPFNNAQSILQAQLRFDFMLWLRMINVGGFMVFLAANFFLGYGIEVVMYAFLIANLISSLIASMRNWDGIRFTFMANRKTNKTILDFGKFTTGTLIGSNLLKSSDTFIIGLSPFLGTTGVALYSIPLKLTEIIEIPLRSFAATAFPNMSKASIENNKEWVRHIFYENAGGMTFLLIPLMLVCFVFAEQIVYILGGPDYVQTANIFRVFCIYGLLLPIDRFIGVALDSINKPKLNFIKVIYMTTFNIIGDIIVIFGLSFVIAALSYPVVILYSGFDIQNITSIVTDFTLIKTLEMVAIVTILFTLVGIGVGFHYLNREIGIGFRKIFTIGFYYIFSMIKNILNR